MSGILYLFDVDGTLTHPRKRITQHMSCVLRKLSEISDVAVVSGSAFETLREQLLLDKVDNQSIFRFIFAENGVDGYHVGEPLGSLSMRDFLGSKRMDDLLHFLESYMIKLALPVERGPFIEFRKALINISLLGRSATEQERQKFIQNDREKHLRDLFVKALSPMLTELSLSVAIGGQTSIDIFPAGWNKTYCLDQIEQIHGLAYSQIFFFGDKTFNGGNDFEIFHDPRTIGNSTTGPQKTVEILETILSSYLISKSPQISELIK